MCSRFSAFAVGDADYLQRTWHPATRPRAIDLDPELNWYRLDVLASRGGPFDDGGMVEFIAYYRSPAGRGQVHERSRFEKVDGHWLYLHGLQLG